VIRRRVHRAAKLEADLGSQPAMAISRASIAVHLNFRTDVIPQLNHLHRRISRACRSRDNPTMHALEVDCRTEPFHPAVTS
jgi:hypothetical protein